MPLNAKHVYAPTPDQTPVTGAVAVAPLGTLEPASAGSPLGAEWNDGGYVDENGLSLTVTRSTTPIRDWSKANVRNLLSEFGGAIAIGFLQVDQFAAERVFGAGNVTVQAATNVSGEVMRVAIGAELPPREAWCFSMKDGDARIRVFVPIGQITDVSQLDYKPDTGHVMGGTLQCYDDGTGHSIYVIYDDGTVLAGSSNTALASLTIGDIALSPAFYPGTLNYTAETANASDAVSAAASDSAATVAITANGTTISSGDSVTWSSGANVIVVNVTNGGVTRDYTVIVFA